MIIKQLRSILLLLLCICSGAYAEIGMVTYTKGSVQALLNGSSRSLARRSELFTGDEIKTGSDSSAKLRFSDASVIDLGANTDFLIKQYLYSQAKAVANRGTDTFTGKLLTGKLKTVTGSIARVNQSGYSMEVGLKNRKPVAVIAVRGTNYSVNYAPSANLVMVNVLAGKIAVNNILVNRGERLNFDVKSNTMTLTNAIGQAKQLNMTGEGALTEAEQEEQIEQLEKNDEDTNDASSSASTASSSGAPGLDENYVLIDSGGFIIAVPVEAVFLFVDDATVASTTTTSTQDLIAEDSKLFN